MKIEHTYGGEDAGAWLGSTERQSFGGRIHLERCGGRWSTGSISGRTSAEIYLSRNADIKTSAWRWCGLPQRPYIIEKGCWDLTCRPNTKYGVRAVGIPAVNGQPWWSRVVGILLGSHGRAKYQKPREWKLAFMWVANWYFNRKTEMQQKKTALSPPSPPLPLSIERRFVACC